MNNAVPKLIDSMNVKEFVEKLIASVHEGRTLNLTKLYFPRKVGPRFMVWMDAPTDETPTKEITTLTVGLNTAKLTEDLDAFVKEIKEKLPEDRQEEFVEKVVTSFVDEILLDVTDVSALESQTTYVAPVAQVEDDPFADEEVAEETPEVKTVEQPVVQRVVRSPGRPRKHPKHR